MKKYILPLKCNLIHTHAKTINKEIIMSFANKHNTAIKLFDYEIEPNLEYKTPAQLHAVNPNTTHAVRAIYINTKGRYGDAPVIATGAELVNAPQHMLNTAKEILNDAESIGLINRGYVGFKTYTYQSANHGEQVGIQWVDINP